MWTDGAFVCAFEDEEGNTVATVVKQSGGTWAVFDPNKLNDTGTGALRVAAGFPDAAAGKKFVDDARAGSTSEHADAGAAASNTEA